MNFSIGILFLIEPQTDPNLYEELPTCADDDVFFTGPGSTKSKKPKVSQSFMGDNRQWIKKAQLPVWHHARK